MNLDNVKMISRIRNMSVSQIPTNPDLLKQAIYAINHGRGSDKAPIALSIPYDLYEKVAEIFELVDILIKHGELLSLLRRAKFAPNQRKETLKTLIKGTEIDLTVLRQMIFDDIVNAMNFRAN